MERIIKPRYTVGTVSTNDKNKALHMLKIYAASNMTHEQIYEKGIEVVEKELLT